MQRPSAARETLRLSPLMETGWAYSSRIERVPQMTALAKPLVLFQGRPAAQRAADVRRFRLARFLLLFKLTI